MSKEIIINLQKVSKEFKGEDNKIVLFQDVDWSLREGDFVSIQGKSGIGKSSLLHILGLLDDVSRGDFFLFGKDANKWKEKEKSKVRSRELGFMFQFHYLLYDFTGWENILIPLQIQGNLNKKTKAFARQLLEMVNLTHRLNHRPSQMSGGERQRFSLIRALVHKPKILLADEPTGNLDVESGKNLYELLKLLKKEIDLSIILVTHDTELASKADHKWTMQDKKLLLQSS